MSRFKAKMDQIQFQFNFGWSTAPDHAGGAYSTPPDLLPEFKGCTSKGEGKEGGERSPLLFFCAHGPTIVAFTIQTIHKHGQ